PSGLRQARIYWSMSAVTAGKWALTGWGRPNKPVVSSINALKANVFRLSDPILALALPLLSGQRVYGGRIVFSVFSLSEGDSMLHRKGVAMVAACAALACTGMVRAGSVDPVSDQGVVERPSYLQVTAAPAAEPTTAPASAPATPPKPLMGLLEGIGIGKPMEDAGFTVGGYIEGGYTVSANGDNVHSLMAGRVFDTKNNRPVLDQID